MMRDNLNIIDNVLPNIDYLPLVRNNPDTSKGDFGSVVIIGGNSSMLGAIHLAGRAAMLMGAGKVVLAPLNWQCPVDILMPELMIKPLTDILPKLNQFTVVVIGPGFGIDEHAIAVLTQVLDYQYLPTSKLIFDADALNLIACNESLRTRFINLLPFNKIITPHPGEAGRLLSIKATEVQSNRIDIILQLSTMYKCVTLLKGYESLICAYGISESMCSNTNDLKIFINKTGNQSLSSAGQGDVLCGLIAGLAAQGVTFLSALQLAVYMHGLSANDLVREHGGYNGLLASEVALNCRKLLNKILYT